MYTVLLNVASINFQGRGALRSLILIYNKCCNCFKSALIRETRTITVIPTVNISDDKTVSVGVAGIQLVDSWSGSYICTVLQNNIGITSCEACLSTNVSFMMEVEIIAARLL